MASSEFSHVDQLGLTGSSPELETEGQVTLHTDIIQLSVARAVTSEDEAVRGGGREEKGGRRDGRGERESERRAEGSQRRSERSAPNEEAQPFTTNEISRAF